MSAIEYLSHFSDEGATSVEVRVVGGGNLPIRKKFMNACEIERLLVSKSGGFIKTMTFDEHLYAISRFEIHPDANKLTIWVAAGA